MQFVQAFFALLLLVSSAVADHSATARIAGTVLDPDGKPVAEATVLVNGVTDFIPPGKDPTTVNKADLYPSTTTDASGKYELTFSFEPSATPVVTGIRAEKPDYARSAIQPEFKLHDGDAKTLNITLRPGEILSGVIRLNPFTKLQLQEAPILKDALKELRYGFRVKGDDYEGMYVAEKDGSFKIYVPHGQYHITVYGVGKTFERDSVKSGTEGLQLEPVPFVWSEESVGKVFDEFWQTMDSQYSYFFLKPDVDWTALRDKYRPRAIQAKNAAELAKVLQEMLAPLKDLHVWIELQDTALPTCRSSYSYNGNGQVTLHSLADTVKCGDFAVVGKTKSDSFGYFLMIRQSSATPENVRQVVEAIQQLRDVPGLIVDLRKANGGSEPLALDIASQFCAQDTVYAKSKYRNGPGHKDFGPEGERHLTPSEHPFPKPVVCLIGPGAVSSGEGFVKMMKCLPQVTTVGLRTRGASGNPQPFDLDGTGISVWFSRWLDLLPDGQTFEGSGIPPDVKVDVPASEYAQADPTLEKGIEILREKISRGDHIKFQSP